MARKGKMTCLEKRELLNRSVVSLDVLKARGEHYEELNLVHDAVDLYEKAGANDALRKLLNVAVEEGDTFLFRRLCRILKYQPGEEEWLSLARQADALGKQAFAAEASRECGEETIDD